MTEYQVPLAPVYADNCLIIFLTAAITPRPLERCDGVVPDPLLGILNGT